MTKGIYKLTNTKDNKVYIGQSIDIENRFKDHMYLLKNNQHHAYKLQRLYNQNKNVKSFKVTFEILEVVNNEDHLSVREQYYIDLYDSHHNGYNSIGLNGSLTHTRRREALNKKIDKINNNLKEYERLVDSYGNSLYLQQRGYNDTYLNRVNSAIKYFVANYNLDLYKAEITQYKHNVELFIIDKDHTVVQVYEYKTAASAMGLHKYKNRLQCDRIYYAEQDRYRKFSNIVKSRNRYKWFLKRFHRLDGDIIKHNTLKYVKNRCSIPFKYIRKAIGYNSNNFKKHIIDDKEIQKLSKELGVSYSHGRAELAIHNQ